ncbi:LemA family protein [Williamwhitmania taraxaci]|uniref:LemA protein n=1 Tax=Williamwhitmania taraxaci TaxID=1640674 RepID=A0A1G6P989_9BACT|nr:LemA family protein [Williamwhitmania taraxaci]SDC76568.1 LemA protein [Williamwhitmania taraxaci]
MNIVGIIVLVIVAIYLLAITNGLIRSRNKIDYAIGGMDAMLKKRVDIIPNLVAAVKEYMRFEEDTQAKIVSLRNQNKESFMQIDDDSSKIIKTILLTVENYPELKANNSFLHLQQTLSEVEEQLSAARRTYNAHVLNYNNKVETIPSNLFAKLLDYKTMPMFAIEESDRQKPDIKKLFNA